MPNNKPIRLSEKGQRPVLGLINAFSRHKLGVLDGSVCGGNTPGGADSDCAPGSNKDHDVLYGFGDELKK